MCRAHSWNGIQEMKHGITPRRLTPFCVTLRDTFSIQLKDIKIKRFVWRKK